MNSGHHLRKPKYHVDKKQRKNGFSYTFSPIQYFDFYVKIYSNFNSMQGQKLGKDA